MVVVEVCDVNPCLYAGVLSQDGNQFTPQHFAKRVKHCVEVGVLVLRGEGLTEECLSEQSAALWLLAFNALRSLDASNLPTLWLLNIEEKCLLRVDI